MNKHLTPDEMRQLSVAERLKLIEELWDSLDTEADHLPIPVWHREEIDKRLDALENATSVGASWDEVHRRITGKS